MSERAPPPDPRQIAALVARVFSRAVPLVVARVPEGVSTYVYRVRRGDETFFLRVLPERGASFAPEAYAHRLLHGQGVRVPDVTYYEHRNEDLGLSAMVTTAIPGRAIGHGADANAVRVVCDAAGRDLARINAVPVAGFGWVRRDRAHVTALEGEEVTAAAFLLRDLDAHLACVRDAGLLSTAEMGAIAATVTRHEGCLRSSDARLAHGDFDATHIFAAGGAYTGIIDFGELRGAPPLYDLAHFLMEHAALLPAVLAGYAAIAPLPPDVLPRLHLLSLLIRVRTLARMVRYGRDNAHRDRTAATIRENLGALHA